MSNKIPLTLSIEKKVWEAFKKLCNDNDTVASWAIQTYMEKKLIESKK